MSNFTAYGDSVAWLLEEDTPAVRHLALRDLLDRPPDDAELVAARDVAYGEGPIPTMLAALEDKTYWTRPGASYHAKYRGLVWSLITLAQLGASAALDERIAEGCAYLLDHALTADGRFSIQGAGAPSANIECFHGNMCAALLDLGYDDPRLELAFEWAARGLTGEGVAPKEEKDAERRYYAGNCGPDFACAANGELSCAWGGVKIMLAFSKLPHDRHTPLIKRAIKRGADFFFSTDPAKADYPTRTGGKPNRKWWKFSFPVFYITDLLQNVEALVGLGYGNDPRLANALNVIREKQDDQGRWPLEFDYAGKSWVDFGPKKQPNKWVTLRALRVLKAVG